MFAIQIGSLTVSVIDIVIFAVCMISAVFCCIRGFVMELSKWVGIVVGVLVAIMFTGALSPTAASLLPETWPPLAATAIAFVVLFLAGFLIIVLLGSMLRKIIETFRLGALDHILGFIWGLVFCLLVVSVIVYLLGMQIIFDMDPVFGSSVIITRMIMPFLPETMEVIGNVAGQGMSVLQGAANGL